MRVQLPQPRLWFRRPGRRSGSRSATDASPGAGPNGVGRGVSVRRDGLGRGGVRRAIKHAVPLYHCFSPSLRDIGTVLVAVRRVVASCEDVCE